MSSAWFAARAPEEPYDGDCNQGYHRDHNDNTHHAGRHRWDVFTFHNIRHRSVEHESEINEADAAPACDGVPAICSEEARIAAGPMVRISATFGVA